MVMRMMSIVHACLFHVTVPADYGDDNADGVDDDEDDDDDD